MSIETITVGDLIKALEKLPSDTKIAFSYYYPDHWGTEIVEPIDDGLIQFKNIKESVYHDGYKVTFEDESEEVENILIISNMD